MDAEHEWGVIWENRQEAGGDLGCVRAILLLAALLLAGCASPSAPGPEPSTLSPEPSPVSSQPSPVSRQPSADSPRPVWSLTAIDGTTYTSEEPASNATIFFFMATWCGTCRVRAPILADVSEAYAARGVAIYSLDFDPSETADDLRAWQERYHQDWPHAIDEGLRLQRQFEVRAQSSVLVLDAEGALVEHFGYGKVTDAGLRAALDRALAA